MSGFCCSYVVIGDDIGRSSSKINNKLWRSLYIKTNIAYFCLSCNEGHPSDINDMSLVFILQGQSSCSLLNYFNFIDIMVMV